MGSTLPYFLQSSQFHRSGGLMGSARMPALPLGARFSQSHDKLLVRISLVAQFHSASTKPAQRLVIHLAQALTKPIKVRVITRHDLHETVPARMSREITGHAISTNKALKASLRTVEF